MRPSAGREDLDKTTLALCGAAGFRDVLVSSHHSEPSTPAPSPRLRAGSLVYPRSAASEKASMTVAEIGQSHWAPWMSIDNSGIILAWGNRQRRRAERRVCVLQSMAVVQLCCSRCATAISPPREVCHVREIVQRLVSSATPPPSPMGRCRVVGMLALVGCRGA